MKKLVSLAMIVLLLATGCGSGLKKYENVYKHGTMAKYNVFVNDVYVGSATYTFTFEKYKDVDCIKILRSSETNNKVEGFQDDVITNNTQVYFDAKSYKPLFSKNRVEWTGTTAGWQESESEYGDMIVKWTNKTPAGSASKEIKFKETYYDDDELSWIVPLRGYKEDERYYYTAFANRSGQPVQGLIWTGTVKEIEVGGKKYKVFSASVRFNEINQNIWVEESTGRIVKFEQNQGFLGYPASLKETPEGIQKRDANYVETLDAWTDPRK